MCTVVFAMDSPYDGGMNASRSAYQDKTANVAGYSAVVTCFVLPISTSLTTIFLALTTLLILLSGRIFTQWRRWLSNPMVLGFLATYAVILLGSLYSVANFHQLKHDWLKHLGFVQAAILVPVFFDQKWRQRALYAFVVSVVISVVVSYLHFYVWHFPQRLNLALSSAFKDNIIQSLLFAIVLAWCLYNSCRYRGWRQWSLIAISALILFDNFALTLSRTGYCVTTVVLIYWAWRQFNWRWFCGVVAAIMVGLLAFYQWSPVMHQRINDAWNNTVAFSSRDQSQPAKVDVTSAGLRLQMLKRGFWAFRQNPWWGSGTASFIKMNQLYQHQYPGRAQYDFNLTNSVYLNVMVFYGAIGLLLFFFLMLTLWYGSRCLPARERYFVRVLIIALLVGGLMNSWLNDSTPAHVFTVLQAVCFGAYCRKRDKPLSSAG